jgi:hypothetical protein
MKTNAFLTNELCNVLFFYVQSHAPNTNKLSQCLPKMYPYYEAIHGIIYATFICNVDLGVTLGLLRYLILEVKDANTR